MVALSKSTLVIPTYFSPPRCDATLLSDLEILERRYRNLFDINKCFVQWRCRIGQLEQQVALYRAWEVLPESLQRSVTRSPELLETLKDLSSDEKDAVLADAWRALSDYVNGSWRRLKQCVDATVEDIRRRELLSEIELRIIQVQCSPPVMWVIPSRRITFPGSEAMDAPQSLKEQKSRVSVMAETIWYLGFSFTSSKSATGSKKTSYIQLIGDD